jgi:hypothetical protein
MLEKINGTNFYGVNRNINSRSSNLEIFFFGFPTEKKTHLGKFKKRWFDPFRT